MICIVFLSGCATPKPEPEPAEREAILRLLVAAQSQPVQRFIVGPFDVTLREMDCVAQFSGKTETWRSINLEVENVMANARRAQTPSATQPMPPLISALIHGAQNQVRTRQLVDEVLRHFAENPQRLDTAQDQLAKDIANWLANGKISFFIVRPDGTYRTEEIPIDANLSQGLSKLQQASLPTSAPATTPVAR